MLGLVIIPRQLTVKFRTLKGTPTSEQLSRNKVTCDREQAIMIFETAAQTEFFWGAHQFRQNIQFTNF